FIGDIAQRPVEARPSIRSDLSLKGHVDLVLAARTKLQRNALSRAIAKTAADVFAADDKVLTVIGAAADEDMDVRIVGVPAVDRDPIELGAEIPLDIEHQLARERLEVAELGAVFRRDDEAEMMAVILAAFGEGAFIRCVGGRIEHPRVLAV